MSTIIKQLQVRRDDLTQSRVVSVDAAPLEPGEVLARIDSFALTANNVTYGVSGDSIGYWNFFPAAEGWGHIPVWGYATVIESRCDEVPVGEQVWGFLPMASHVVMQPSGVRHGHFVDAAAHRAALPSLYNRYQNTAGDPPALKALADERSGLFPLFTTSYVIADFLADNDWFGARQVIVLSASSKTGFGLANILHNWADKPVSVIGATSGGNRDFVESLGICDQVIAYDQIDALDPQVPTIVVDMAGSAPILTAVHTRFGDNLVYSCIVGATHWTAERGRAELPGAKPTFFFAPSQILKREADWGPGEILRRAQAEGIRMAGEIKGQVELEHLSGADACADALSDMVAGKVSPRRLLILSLA